MSGTDGLAEQIASAYLASLCRICGGSGLVHHQARTVACRCKETSSMKPTSGRVVLYVSPDHGDAVVIRPALVIAACAERFPGSSYTREECQLSVFWDGTNDATGERDPGKPPVAPAAWRTSVPHDEGKAPGTWHWPPRS